MKIGFTGTQRGMTRKQANRLASVLKSHKMEEFHHGDCIGADAKAHSILTKHFPNVKVIIHPPNKAYKRAFCISEHILPQKKYVERNRDIVDKTNLLVATPKELKEQLRGGTWYTVRYARKKKKSVIIIYPNGRKQAT